METNIIKEFKEWLKRNEKDIKECFTTYGCCYLTLLEYDDTEVEEELTEVNIELNEGVVITIPFPQKVIGKPDDYEWRYRFKDIVESELRVDVLLDGVEWDSLVSADKPKRIFDYWRDSGCIGTIGELVRKVEINGYSILDNE